MKHILVPQKELASWLALGVRRVRELTTMGVLTQTTAHTYELKASVQAYLVFSRAKTGTLTNERARLVKAQADMSELKVRHRTGELVLRAAVEREIFAANRATRDAFFNLPPRCSGILAADTNQHTIHALLTKEIHAILEALSGQDPHLSHSPVAPLAPGHAPVPHPARRGPRHRRRAD